jgi:hypothetical protein
MYVPVEYPIESYARSDAQAPAAYRPGTAAPDAVSTWPVSFVFSPPSVKPLIGEVPKVQLMAVKGPWVSGCIH